MNISGIKEKSNLLIKTGSESPSKPKAKKAFISLHEHVKKEQALTNRSKVEYQTTDKKELAEVQNPKGILKNQVEKTVIQNKDTDKHKKCKVSTKIPQKLNNKIPKERLNTQHESNNFTFHPQIYSTTAQARYLQPSPKLTADSSRAVYGKEYTDVEKLSEENESKFDIKKFMARQRLYEINRKQRLEYLIEAIEKDLPPKPEERSKGSKDGWFSPKIRGLPKNFRKVCVSAQKTRKTPEPTFTPNLTKSKKYEKIESKLQLKDNISTLMKRIKEKVETKERTYDHERYIRTLKEEIECTYKPRVIQTPKYLRKNRSNSPDKINATTSVN